MARKTLLNEKKGVTSIIHAHLCLTNIEQDMIKEILESRELSPYYRSKIVRAAIRYYYKRRFKGDK